VSPYALSINRPIPARLHLPPEAIRDRLSRLFAEARLLRSPVRLAESKSRTLESDHRADGREVSHAN
jgi:hypothetical protein